MGFLHCLSKPEYLPCVNIPAPFCNLCFGKIHRPFLDFPPVSLSFVLTFFLLCSASTEFTSLFCSAAKGGRPSDKKSFERKKCRGACRHRYFFQDKGIAGTFTVWRTGLTLPKPKKARALGQGRRNREEGQNRESGTDGNR